MMLDRSFMKRRSAALVRVRFSGFDGFADGAQATGVSAPELRASLGKRTMRAWFPDFFVDARKRFRRAENCFVAGRGNESLTTENAKKAP